MTTAPRSHLRSLISDLTDLLGQQMYFWGCDVRHSEGNLLLRYGMTRIARASMEGEGTSRYQMSWQEGVVELHGFCAGWYPTASQDEKSGLLYQRGNHRLRSCTEGCPLTPGHYEEERLLAADRDAMLVQARPLLEWVIAYESWVQEQTVEGYRDLCWQRLVALPRGKAWLAPSDALAWVQSFLSAPETTPRARRFGATRKESGRFSRIAC